jgi:hypothetical protein
MYGEWLKLGIMTPYFKFKANRIINLKYISNRDMMLLIIEASYLKREKQLEELNLLKEIAKNTYQQGLEEANGKSRRNTDLYLIGLLLLPNKVTGTMWSEYKNSTNQYNADQISKQALINIQQGKDLKVKNPEFQSIFKTQQSRYLNKKKGIDKFSGALDTEVSYIVNNVLLQAYLDNGIEKVRFVSILDEVTSKMCKSLDNQIFWIAKENRFYRWSESEKLNVLKITQGLESGVNLPPINDSFHYCRSTIYREVSNEK